MTQEIVSKCGLDFKNAQLQIEERKDFGPHKFRTNTVDVFCNSDNCELSAGIEVKFPAIAKPTSQEVVSVFEEIATNAESTAFANLERARLNNCPVFKRLYSSQPPQQA